MRKKRKVENRNMKVGVVISVAKRGKKSAGIILNKMERKTRGFFFGAKENFKPGDKVRYKFNRETGTAFEVEKF